MKARRRSRLAALALVAGRAAAQTPTASPTYDTWSPTRRPTPRPSSKPTSSAPTYWTPAPFAAPPDDYDRDTFDHDPGTCGNYAPNEVYTAEALGLKGAYALANDGPDEECCYEYVHNDCTHNPTGVPTLVPTALPTAVPTAAPSKFKPTAMPVSDPTKVPTTVPSSTPTTTPTTEPTKVPTTTPTTVPTSQPSEAPSPAPSKVPTGVPTEQDPTPVPTKGPTSGPTEAPIPAPSPRPTNTRYPTPRPSPAPSTQVPTPAPSAYPTPAPTPRPVVAPEDDDDDKSGRRGLVESAGVWSLATVGITMTGITIATIANAAQEQCVLGPTIVFEAGTTHPYYITPNLCSIGTKTYASKTTVRGASPRKVCHKFCEAASEKGKLELKHVQGLTCYCKRR